MSERAERPKRTLVSVGSSSLLRRNVCPGRRDVVTGVVLGQAPRMERPRFETRIQCMYTACSSVTGGAASKEQDRVHVSPANATIKTATGTSTSFGRQRSKATTSRRTWTENPGGVVLLGRRGYAALPAGKCTSCQTFGSTGAESPISLGLPCSQAAQDGAQRPPAGKAALPAGPAEAQPEHPRECVIWTQRVGNCQG
ncbi:hypothetical protein PYCCODRAFT_1225002 [Trametes coccinea BRFM310]|uniref:Uncharacterized protein n=1 Tax=Trametes coccinea (strain BRFM310) TaxID=1353009 RepID=A0A1Y2IW17_TRAC3|nr:hypothetical protein PYCCODRAFT_1225002 [Trametes coccinea BRFM310]